MKNMIEVIESKNISAHELMQLDANLLQSVTSSQAKIHLFQWPVPCVSIGCLLAHSKLLVTGENAIQEYPIVRRPTGGGVMIHGCDLCFSLALGPEHPLRSYEPLALYKWVHGVVAQSLERTYPVLQGRFSWIDESANVRDNAKSCCMHHPTRYDLALDGKKIMGSAQRRKKGLLHQCSLHIEAPCRALIEKLFVDGQAYANQIAEKSTWLEEFITIDKRELKDALVQELSNSLAL